MTNNTKKEMLKRQTQASFPYLIEITYYHNDDTSEVFRYANSDNDIIFEGNTYYASCFSIQPPERKQDSISDATITISAINQEWIQRIRATNKRAKIRFVAVIQNGTDIEPIEDIDFELTKAKWNDVSISWTMEFDNLLDVQVPMETIDEIICPALA